MIHQKFQVVYEQSLLVEALSVYEKIQHMCKHLHMVHLAISPYTYTLQLVD